MELTITLPDNVFACVTQVAHQTHRRVDEVITEKIVREFTVSPNELARQMACCSDKEILGLAQVQMPAQSDRRLSNLLQKQGAQDLTVNEQDELRELMELSRLTTLKKAFALREIARRGLHDKN